MKAHQAILAHTGPDVFDSLQSIAQDNGFDVTRSGKELVIAAPLGRVALYQNSNATRVDFSASTPTDLQVLVDLYAARFEKLDLAAGISWAAVKRHIPLNQTLCTVRQVSRISPNFVRLRLAGDFAAFAQKGAGLHFRFLLGAKGLEWPHLDITGVTVWPGGMPSWHRPPYTVRRLSRDGLWMDVDIVLHEGGRMTQWCDAAQPGDQIALTGPSGSKHPSAKRLHLMGDETALPVILRIIEDAPAGTQGSATIAIRDPSDAQEVRTPGDFSVDWVPMNCDVPLRAAAQALKPDQENAFVFFAGERALATEVRAILNGKGFAPSQVKAAAYWTKNV